MTRRLRTSDALRVFAVLALFALPALSRGQVQEFPVPTAGAAPEDIAAGSDGALWFTEKDAAKIGRITTQGAFTEYPLAAGAEPEGITGGPDGNLWFTERETNKIGRISTSGTLTEFPVPQAGAVPTAITAGPDGNLWFTERSGNRIGRITPSGVVTEFPLPAGSSGPDSIAAGSDGRLWFAMQISAQIGRITTSGTIEVSPMPSLGAGGTTGTPRDVTTGPDQNIWITVAFDNPVGGTRGALLQIVPGNCSPAACTITPFSLAGAGAVEGVTSGPDDQLWVADRTSGAVLRVSASGGILGSFPLTAGSNPRGIASGPDSAVWVAEDDGNRIARVAAGAGGPTPTPGGGTPTPTHAPPASAPRGHVTPLAQRTPLPQPGPRP